MKEPLKALWRDILTVARRAVLLGVKIGVTIAVVLIILSLLGFGLNDYFVTRRNAATALQQSAEAVQWINQQLAASRAQGK